MLMLMVALIAVGCLLAWSDWRRGIAMAILIAMIQDPLRKIIPGTPAILTMASLPVWLVAAAAAIAERRSSIQWFFGTFPVLAKWLQIFGFYLIIPAALSLSYGKNSWQITLLGAFVYASTFVLVMTGWALPKRRQAALSLVMFYILCGSVFLIGGPLEYFGWSAKWKTIGTEALGHFWMTNRMGGTMAMLSGFFRSPDIMGWHAVMVFMFSVIMATRSRGAMRYFWIATGIWAFLNLWLCGRRKMLSMIPFFFGSYLLLIFKFQTTRRIFSLLGILLILMGIGWNAVDAFYRNDKVNAFYLTTFDEWDERVSQEVYGSVIVTIQQAGFWGYGLGMSQQGIHNINAEKPRVWQESGPTKLFAELGVPGAVLFMLLGFAFLRTGYEVIRANRRTEHIYLLSGLFSILIANLASSAVSGQIFGDPFVTLFLALIMGLLLSGGNADAECVTEVLP